MPIQDIILQAKDKLAPQDVEVVIFHWPCSDGLGAALSAWVANPAITFIPLQYDTPLSPEENASIHDKNVLMVDISFKKDRLEDVRKYAKKIVTLDHHDTAMRELADDPDCFFVLENSGAMLAWHYFHGFEKPAPRLIRLLEDRDLWRWSEREDSEPLHYAILDKHPGPYYRELVQYLNETDLNELITHGKTFMSAIKELCRTFYASAQQKLYQDQESKKLYSVLSIYFDGSEFSSNLLAGLKLKPMQYVSEIADYIRTQEDVDIVMLWHQLPNSKYKISFRSNKHYVHCGLIANQFAPGGGGHKAAGSAMVEKSPMDFLLDKPRKLALIAP